MSEKVESKEHKQVAVTPLSDYLLFLDVKNDDFVLYRSGEFYRFANTAFFTKKILRNTPANLSDMFLKNLALTEEPSKAKIMFLRGELVSIDDYDYGSEDGIFKNGFEHFKSAHDNIWYEKSLLDGFWSCSMDKVGGLKSILPHDHIWCSDEHYKQKLDGSNLVTFCYSLQTRLVQTIDQMQQQFGCSSFTLTLSMSQKYEKITFSDRQNVKSKQSLVLHCCNKKQLLDQLVFWSKCTIMSSIVAKISCISEKPGFSEHSYTFCLRNK